MAKTILIIEDEVDIRKVYSEVLEDAGFIVTQTGDGEEGMGVVETGKWDLLLLDIMLPKLDGIEVLKRIMSRENLRVKPVILLSNLERDSIVKKCMELGAKAYLIKSNVNPEQVVGAVKLNLPNELQN